VLDDHPFRLGQMLSDEDRLAAVEATELLDATRDEAFDRLTRLATRVLRAPVALVSLVTDERQYFASSVGLPEPWGSEQETPLSHSLCQHVVLTGLPLLVEDARESIVLQDNLAIRDLGVVAYAGMPLRTSDGHVLGSFCVIDHHPRSWTAAELEALADLAGAAMSEIALRRVVAQTARLYAREHTIAHTLQQSLLPPRLPELGWLDRAARYRAAGEGIEVGGDFYDLVETGPDGCVAVIGDVCGKGPQAAALTGLARHTLRTLAIDGVEPVRALHRLSDAIYEHAEDTRFCTAIYAALERTEHGASVRIASGGHPHAIVLRADGTSEQIGGTGMLLGWRRDPPLSEQIAELQPGDVLILYTDGLTDTTRVQVGVDAVVGAATTTVSRHPAEIADALERLATANGELSDDLAVLVLRVAAR
jgi:sigma-B regulation protein RsbU (phosphoserine phosphatase)